jgi:NAD(P)H-flavin reductase
MQPRRTLFRKKVESVTKVAENIYLLSFLRDFQFKAGQVIALDLEEFGKPRLYSIASGESEKFIEILFDEKDDGKLTPPLSKLNHGDSIYVSEPFGNFQDTSEKAWWIAAGTGVAPFASMARSGLAVNKNLIHGGRMAENFYFSKFFEKEMDSKYIRCSSVQESTEFFNGRLTDWLQKQQNLPVDHLFYLCGSAEMVVQVRDILISKGIPFQHIVSETYF